ncbi:MAG TPA: hypothetical protein DCS66_20345 [Flavobacteriaceae bacterium]|nr:hypothetical protein [Flavobacteriaceae bacterium]|tara:strand:- start:221 stop:403 length:183 start_codon:yes stop_codon:yes gene_type:complete
MKCFNQKEQKVIDDLFTLAEDLLYQLKKEKWEDVYSNIEDLKDLMNNENFPYSEIDTRGA